MSEAKSQSARAQPAQLDRLESGMPVLAADGTVFRVSAELAATFEPGDALAANAVGGLLHIPANIRRLVDAGMTECAAAFASMGGVADEQIVQFFHAAAAALQDDVVWNDIAQTNAEDVERARSRHRSTTRLEVSQSMRTGMIEGLRGWAAMPTQRNAVLESIQHEDFRIDLLGAALGPVGFVFEGRPNVLADACGVLRGGNTVIFRIGSDALATANTIMQRVIRPALRDCGLPAGAVTLIDSAAHAAGWGLFLDARLALAVARGSGSSVELLGALAQSVGTPVSLHGTGGAWMMVGVSADAQRLATALVRSLDRKVCNTLNTCCLPAARAAELVPVLLRALQQAADVRGHPFKLHVAPGAEVFVPEACFEAKVQIARAQGSATEAQAERLSLDGLSTEWEWEDSPEISLVVVDSLAQAVGYFNAYSPRLLATLISEDAAEHQQFFDELDAPFVGDDHTRWVDGQFALNKPELGLSNWANGRLFGRGAVLTGDLVFTVRTRYLMTGK